MLISSWRACGDLIYARNTGADEATRTLAWSGCGLAVGLLCVQAAFILRYVNNYRAMAAQQAAQRTTAAGKHATDGRKSVALFSTLSAHRLQYRLSYQTKRFSSRAPHWQFVIWLRQALMVAVTFLPWMMGASLCASPEQDPPLATIP